MAAYTDFFENRLIDGLFRGGCLTTAGAAGSSTVVAGIRAATTAYTLGQILVPAAGDTGAGGKLLKVTTAGTTGAGAVAVPNPGSTVADGSVTWTAIATMPALDVYYVGLLTSAPTDSTAGTEVSGGSYARVLTSATLANWAGTQAAASTTASSGATGTTSNNGIITFPTPSAGWGTVVAMGLYDALTGGNLLVYAGLAINKTINQGDAVTFPAASLTIQTDN